MKKSVILAFSLIAIVLFISGCQEYVRGVNVEASAEQQNQEFLRTYTYDADKNGEVDFDDFFLFSDAFNSKEGDALYNRLADFDRNRLIDNEDFFAFAGFFGQKIVKKYERPDVWVWTKPSKILKVDGGIQSASDDYADAPLIDTEKDFSLMGIKANDIGYIYLFLLPIDVLQEGGLAFVVNPEPSSRGGSYFEYSFFLPQNAPDSVFIRLNHLTSSFSGRRFGFSPITLYVNEFIVLSHYNPKDTGLISEDTGNIKQFLEPGKVNKIKIELDALKDSDPYKMRDRAGNVVPAGTRYWMHSVDVLYGQPEKYVYKREEVAKPAFQSFTFSEEEVMENPGNFSLGV